MDADRWRRVEEVLDVALTRDPAERAAVLDASCSGEPELRREVEGLLGRLDNARDFLDSPPNRRRRRDHRRSAGRRRVGRVRRPPHRRVPGRLGCAL